VDVRNGDSGWFLKGVLKDNSPWIIPLDRPVFTIGRLGGNNLIISSHAVSRNHARITVEADGLYITDLESKNGIGINGSIHRGRNLIREGDVIRLGESEFTLTRQQTHREDLQKTLARDSDTTRISFSEAYGLSDRESEILFHLIRGRNLKFIGENLCISPGTVKNHVLKIYRKTGCHSRIELSTKYSESERVSR
jgi:pSer/pThr/pTyr-binding forkhead associated (FHA) protein